MDNTQPKCIIFVSGLGTTQEYFEPVMSVIPFNSYFFALDDTNADQLSDMIHDILSSGVTKLYIAPFSISCYITTRILQRKDFQSLQHKITLVLIDPPNTNDNFLANLVRSAPNCVLWMWDHVLCAPVRYCILSALSGFRTPKMVDMTLAKMPIQTVKSMVIKYLMPFTPPAGTTVLRGCYSKYNNNTSFLGTQTYVLPSDHHMIWHKPRMVAKFIVYGTIQGRP
jgi:hypothetical protein